jgi:branched-chain amino acid transport system ATP-binding protein
MLVIGRGLIARTRLLLLDEPSLGLSPMLVGEIFKIIKRLNTEQNITILLEEQNARVPLSIADHGDVVENRYPFTYGWGSPAGRNCHCEE